MPFARIIDYCLIFYWCSWKNLCSVVPVEECSNLLFIAANGHYSIWHFWPISKALLKHWFGASIPRRLNDLAKAQKGILELGLNSRVLASLSLFVLPTKISWVSCFSDAQVQRPWPVLLCRGISLLSWAVPRRSWTCCGANVCGWGCLA